MTLSKPKRKRITKSEIQKALLKYQDAKGERARTKAYRVYLTLWIAWARRQER